MYIHICTYICIYERSTLFVRCPEAFKSKVGAPSKFCVGWIKIQLWGKLAEYRPWQLFLLIAYQETDPPDPLLRTCSFLHRGSERFFTFKLKGFNSELLLVPSTVPSALSLETYLVWNALSLEACLVSDTELRVSRQKPKPSPPEDSWSGCSWQRGWCSG